MLFLVALLAYGLYLGWFGFYGDDWSYIWYNRALGYGGPGVFAAVDRPLSGGFYDPLVPLLGENPLVYHLFNLVLRWLSGVFLFWVLNLLWPGKVRPLFAAAALFTVYPSFVQQPIAVEFILHFAVLDLLLLSLGGNILAIKKPKWFWPLMGSAALAAAGMFWLEYFVGLELLRPVLIWIALGGLGLSLGQRVKRTLLLWIPNLLVLGGFIYWRAFVFSFRTSYQPQLISAFKAEPFQALISLARRIGMDLKTVLYNTWKNALRFPEGSSEVVFFILIAAISLVIFWLYLGSQRGETVPAGRKFLKSWGWIPLSLGIFSLLIAGWPFWVTDIPVEAVFPWDRTSLPFMLGASLVLVGVVELLPWGSLRAPVFALLIGIAVAGQFTNALAYKAEWESMRSFYWQLSWRAPGLKPGTLVVSDDIPLYRVSDPGLTAPLNWTYAPDHKGVNIPYRFFDLAVRTESEYSGMPGFEPNLKVKNTYRSLVFEGNTSNLLAVYYHPPACLWLLSRDDRGLPGLPSKVADSVPLSNLNQVVSQVETPAVPPPMMLPEPEHGWCYIYQKAALAVQNKNWNEAVGLWEKAVQKGLKPQDPYELLPFVKAAIMKQDWEKAKALSSEIKNNRENLLPVLCRYWKQSASGMKNPEAQSRITESSVGLGCKP